MSLAHVADAAGLTVDHLNALERGLVSETDVAVRWLVAFYGGVNGDKIDGLLFDHALKSLRSRGRHLRLIKKD